MKNKAIDLDILPYIFFFSSLTVYLYFSFNSLSQILAYEGFNPMEWLVLRENKTNFAENYPGGIENYGKSLVMWGYPLLSSVLKSLTTFKLYIITEIVFLAFAIRYAMRKIGYGKNIEIITTITVILFSYARNINTGNWGQPFFVGQFYNFSDAFRLLSWSVLYFGSIYSASLLSLLSFTIHPAMGAYGWLYQSSMLFSTKQFKGIAIFSILTIPGYIAYYLLIAPTAQVEPMAASDWFNFTKLFNYHWFPIEFGIFTKYFADEWGQFLSFLLLFITALKSVDAKIYRVYLWTLPIVAGLVLFGSLNSWSQFSVTLTKVALQRGNDFFILTALLILVPFLTNKFLYSNKILISLLTSSILLHPFFIRSPYPIAPILCLYFFCNPTPIKLTSLRIWVSRNWLFLAWLVLFSGSTLIAAKHLPSWSHPFYFGDQTVWVISISITLLFFLYKKFSLSNRALLVYALLATGIVCFSSAKKLPEDKKLLYSDYKNIQQWAAENTPTTALFMPPPYLFYGWRLYSKRSSFGTVREWLMTGWAYDSNNKLFHEGVKRFSVLGIDLSSFAGGTIKKEGRKILRLTRKKYNLANRKWFCSVVKKFSVDYFIVEQTHPLSNSRFVQWKNNSFSILKFPHCFDKS